VQNYPVEQEIKDQLKADDLLNRLYGDAQSRAAASLFVAYFKTQRTGQSPHSPKNCLPGAGWEPEAEGVLNVAVLGQPEPIRVNRFVVSHGDEKSVVLYWYQSQRRVIASEFSAKFWLVMDSIRYHRSDTALVRVTIPVTNNDPERGHANRRNICTDCVPGAQELLAGVRRDADENGCCCFHGCGPADCASPGAEPDPGDL
jgi:EpsI family protein